MWFKVDDNLAFHRKVVAAGNAAMGLWVRAGSWCSQHLTDGYVPDHMIAVLGSASQREKLIKVGLWIEVDGGCQFHGWNEKGRQPTSKSVLEEREKAAGRQAKYRTGTYDKPQVDASSNAVTSSSVTPSVTGVVTPTPTRPDQKEEQLSFAPLPESAPEDRFAEFYAAYPRRQDRRAAEKAWKAAIKRRVDPDKVIAAARAYARLQVGNQRRYIKLPATWLNAGSYDDVIEQPNLTLVAPVLASFEEFRLAAAGPEAANLLGVAYVPRPKPPSDQTPRREWQALAAVEWIDDHETAIRSALSEKRTG